MLILVLAFFSLQTGYSQKKMFYNPIGDGQDPWVITAGNNFWYCGSGRGGIYLAVSDSLHSILKTEKKMVYMPPAGTMFSKELWAPELHYLMGRWYIYFAADDGRNENHRMYVLEGGANPENPLDGEYKMKGKVAAGEDKWAIDGTAFMFKDELYFIWSGWPGDVNETQCLYISKMENPYTLENERYVISCPEENWETIGNPTVNEGPQVLVRENTVHIVYSASGSWTDDYCLGLLTCTNEQVLDADSWTKSGPVFSKTKDVFGPGHASYLEHPKTKEWWIIYHAAKSKGAGWNRNVRIQRFKWENNTPVFDKPLSTHVPIKK